jgi:hypothetical protein
LNEYSSFNPDAARAELHAVRDGRK